MIFFSAGFSTDGLYEDPDALVWFQRYLPCRYKCPGALSQNRNAQWSLAEISNICSWLLLDS